MIYELRPDGEWATLPLTAELARQLDEEYAAIDDAAFSYDRRRLRAILETLRAWIPHSPFPNVLAHAIEYGAELDAGIIHPVEYDLPREPEPTDPAECRRIAVEDARKRWDAPRFDRGSIAKRPRSEFQERIIAALGGDNG